jgi:hypothetical protein
MQTIRGFMEIDGLIDNTPFLISELGELSSYSRSFTRDIQSYTNKDYPGFELQIFYNGLDDSTGVIIPITVLEEDIIDRILLITQELYKYAINHSPPYDVNNIKNTIIFITSKQITNLEIGDLIEYKDVVLPKWISFSDNIKGTNSITPNRETKIWYSDESFKTTYDKPIIYVIPPVQNIDNFFLTYSEVIKLINSRNLINLLEDIRLLKGDKPETDIHTLTIKFKPDEYSEGIDTIWTFVTYGIITDNETLEANVMDYIRNHSTHNILEWGTNVFPSLFRKNEFLILPMWDYLAIENISSVGSIRSVIINPNIALRFALDSNIGISASHIQEALDILYLPYKFTPLLFCSADNNSVDSRSIKQIFPDYIPASTHSTDYNRMQLFTQNWCLFLQELIMLAEDTYDVANPTVVYKIITRNNKKYLSAKYGDITYLVKFNNHESTLPGD